MKLILGICAILGNIAFFLFFGFWFFTVVTEPPSWSTGWRSSFSLIGFALSARDLALIFGIFRKDDHAHP